MATAIEEKNNPKSVLNRARDDEPIFILRGTDRTAPILINLWINLMEKERVFGGNKEAGEKIEDAIVARDMMVTWQRINENMVKMPD